MSGGSHCYLYLDDCVAEIAGKQDVLTEVRDRLRTDYERSDSPHAAAALAQTQAVIDALAAVDTLLENAPLRELWRALEWSDSGDDCESYPEQLYSYPLETP